MARKQFVCLFKIRVSMIKFDMFAQNNLVLKMKIKLFSLPAIFIFDFPD